MKLPRTQQQLEEVLVLVYDRKLTSYAQVGEALETTGQTVANFDEAMSSQGRGSRPVKTALDVVRSERAPQTAPEPRPPEPAPDTETLEEIARRFLRALLRTLLEELEE